ncbi:hypothetical protein C0J52_27319 [Blattella germanica]|nr:hypothetical protein C0J52_27319 [Blattella germanica]
MRHSHWEQDPAIDKMGLRAFTGRPVLLRFSARSLPSMNSDTQGNTDLRLGAASPHMVTNLLWISEAVTPSLQRNHTVHLCPCLSVSMFFHRCP